MLENLQVLRVFDMRNTNSMQWKKKSRDKREAIITKTFPTIFPQKFVTAHLEYDYGTWKKIRPFRHAQLLPYLSIELLRDDPLKFLALLYYRTNYDPEQWVAFDKHQLRTVGALGGLAADFCDRCVVFYGPNYGGIVPWDTAQAHRWNIAGFPRGRLLLETQHILIRGLRSTVEEILIGVDRDGSADKWHQLSNTGFNTAAGSEFWSVFSNQAFSPPMFDLNRLVDISKAHIAEAEDEL